MATTSEDDDLVNNNMIEFLNREFGDDIRSLRNVKNIYQNLCCLKDDLENKLSLASTEVPSEIKKAISNAESAQSQVKSFSGEETLLHDEIEKHTKLMEPLFEEISQITSQVDELSRYTQYFGLIAKIDELSSSIQTALLVENSQDAVEAFQDMTNLYTELEISSCENLLRFHRNTILFWYKLLKNKFASEFEDLLKAIKWPFVTVTLSKTPVVNQSKQKNEMASLFTKLLHVNLPSSLQRRRSLLNPALGRLHIAPQVLPLQLMLKPLKKRFKYHFYGNRQTNSLEKPEWYFTQVLAWIRDHCDFLEQTVQPILDQESNLVARVELMRGLVELVLEKMTADLSFLMYDEHLFTHLIDEALLFDGELRNNYSYPHNQPSAMHVLSQEEVFEKWLVVEKRYAMEKIDAMMSSSSAWLSQYRDIADVDELRVPECGESFMTLMQTITDRYKHLPQPQHKLRFLALQQELLEDFRTRLVQVMKQDAQNILGQQYCSILNTASYIVEVLQQWSELTFFLQLQFFKSEYEKEDELIQRLDDPPTMTPNKPTFTDLNLPMDCSMTDSKAILESQFLISLEETIFDDMIDLFERLKSDMLKTVITYVFTDVKARSQPYRKDRWITLPSQQDVQGGVQGLSPTACEMFLILKSHLQTVESLISKPLFNQFWHRLAEKLNKFIFEEVILANHFSDGGAAQLEFDLTRNLFPLFGDYTKKPDAYFRQIKEACILLNLKVGSALLLKDVLESGDSQADRGKHDKNSTQTPDVKSSLYEIGVFKLTPAKSLTIINLRTNLTLG
ncbi:RAD50-interacting protein 1-like [Argonauta hians]